MVERVKKVPVQVEYHMDGVYPLEVRAVEGGWEISCPPGPLADFLLSAAPPTTIKQRGFYVVIQFSMDLDQQILRTIQTLIDLRYRTGRVQLELWGDL